MKGNKYLTKLLKKENIKLQKGYINVVNGTAGSGKTTFIFKNKEDEKGLLYETEKFVDYENYYPDVLYPIPKNWRFSNNLDRVIFVTDNRMNKDNTLNKYESITKVCDKKFFKDAKEEKDFEKWLQQPGKVSVLTYAQFSMIMSKDYLRKFIYSYIELIVMDEFHNLYEFSNRFDKEENNSTGYYNIINYMYPLAVNCLLVCLTATPYYAEIGIENGYGLEKVIYRKLLNEKQISQLYSYEETMIEKTLYPINFIKKISLLNLKGKVLIYTDKIKTANEYKKILTDAGYKTETIFSEGRMNEAQKELKKYLIDNDKYPEDLEILIQNFAYTTGYDLKDKQIQYIIIDSANPTIITQVRNRCRHDIQLLVCKLRKEISWTEREYIKETNSEVCNSWIDTTKNYNSIRIYSIGEKIVKVPYDFEPFNFTIDEKFIGVQLTKELKEEFNSVIDKYAIIDNNNKITNFKKFKNDLYYNGYIVKTIKNKGTYIFRVGEEIIKDYKEVTQNMNEENSFINTYLDSLVGEKLYKESQKELAIKVNARRNGKLLKSHESINSALKEDNVPYEIAIVQTDWNRTTPEGNKNLYYGKVYWIISERK